MREGFIIAPGGWRDPRHTHVLYTEDGMAMTRHPAVPVKRYARPGAPDTANWITSGYWSNATGHAITSLVTRWVVPPPPPNPGTQIIYLFNGIQPADGAIILQPVLQWGDTGPTEDGINRTGPFWTVASWIVPAPDGHAYHTPHRRVYPGDTLTGAITLLSRSAAGFVYRCEFRGLPGTACVTMPIPELSWCTHTLEAYARNGTAQPPYDLASPSDYPDTAMTSFQAIAVTTDAGPNPAGLWMPWDIVECFGEHTVIATNSTSGGQIDIHYRMADTAVVA